jgi:6-phosphofructokinase
VKGLVVHSGGPSPVINASLAGLVEEARRHPEVRGMYGAAFGPEGILKERFIDLYGESAGTIQAIGMSPSSALGTPARA